jgi:hypothetical protein
MTKNELAEATAAAEWRAGYPEVALQLLAECGYGTGEMWQWLSDLGYGPQIAWSFLRKFGAVVAP